MNLLENYEPKLVWKYFEEIASIPHGSNNCEGIRNYLINFAKESGFSYITDEFDNVIIIKEASKGLEKKDTLIIQGHTDMVCEKDPDIDFDFEKDPLDLYIDGDFLKARGTTLGGDDGIAVAIGLALLASDIPLPRIELVLTSNEEIGMIGATNLDTSVLKGKAIINIDSEMDGVFVAGCAGAARMDSHISLDNENITGSHVRFIFKGFTGGHSGMSIHAGRANAHIICAKVLMALNNKLDFRIISICGGTKDNAIPNYITVDALIPSANAVADGSAASGAAAGGAAASGTAASGATASGTADGAATGKAGTDMSGLLNDLIQYFKDEYSETDPLMSVECENIDDTVTKKVLTKDSQMLLLDTVSGINDGVIEADKDDCNLVITSTNNGILQLNEGKCNISVLVRSMIDSDRKKLMNSQIDYFNSKGFECNVSGEYAGWTYNPDSKLINSFLDTYKDLFGKEACAKPMHIGLECGIFAGKIQGLDCISLGPDIFDIHTSKEHLSISSTERCWHLITEAINRL